MKSKPVVPIALVEADQAFSGLLDTLLADVPEYDATAEITEPSIEVSPQISEVLVEAELNIVELQPIQSTETLVAETSPVLPDWAKGEFKLLVVKMGEMRFAVPLVGLSSIAPLKGDDELTSIPGQPAWHKGVMSYRDSNLVVVDLGVLLDTQEAEEESTYILVIDEGRYGLTCRSLEEPLTLSASDINWSKPGARRDWMSGMLKDQMCALLNIEKITQRLK